MANGLTHIIIDVNGYCTDITSNDTLVFFPITPCRVADTRNSTGPLGGPPLFGSTVVSVANTRAFSIPSASLVLIRGEPFSAQADGVVRRDWATVRANHAR